MMNSCLYATTLSCFGGHNFDESLSIFYHYFLGRNVFDEHTTFLSFEVIIIFFRYELDDPEFTCIVDIADVVNETASQGFLQDVIPLLRYLPSPTLNKLTKDIRYVMTWISGFLDEHRKTYSQGIAIKLSPVVYYGSLCFL